MWRSGNLSPRRLLTSNRLLTTNRRSGNRLNGSQRDRKRRRPGLVGIDIGATRVALVELEPDGEGCRVCAFGIEPFAETQPAKNSSQAPVADAAVVGSAIARLAKRARPRSRRAAAAVGGTCVVSEVIELDSSFTDEEIASQIEVDADRLLPFPLADAATDFAVGDLSPNDPAMAQVLLAACPQAQVQRCSSALAIGGFRPAIVDVRLLAMRRALADSWPAGAECTALLELRPDAVAMALFAGAASVPLQCREDATANGSELAEATVAANAENVQLRLSRLLQMQVAAGGESPARYLVAGECALDDGTLDLVRQQTGAQAQLVQPFADMAVATHLDAQALRAAAPELLAACGLALRRFDP